MTAINKRRARARMASLMPSDREGRQDDLRRQFDRSGIDLPADPMFRIFRPILAKNGRFY